MSVFLRIDLFIYVFIYSLILCESVFYLYVCLYESVGFPEIGITDSCELPCGARN